VFLYNIPFFTNPIEARTSPSCCARRIRGNQKDSGGKWDDFVSCKQTGGASGTWPVLIGNDGIWGWAGESGRGGRGLRAWRARCRNLMAAVVARARWVRIRRRSMRNVQEFIDASCSFQFPIGIRRSRGAARDFRGSARRLRWGPKVKRRLDEFRGWFREWLRGSKAMAREMAANERECVCATKTCFIRVDTRAFRLLKTFPLGSACLARAVFSNCFRSSSLP